VDHQTVRTEIEKIVHFGSDQLTTHDLPYTPRVRKALTFAAREAKALNYTGVGAEHVFLGLLLEGSGVAALVLENLGVQIERTRGEILKELSTNPGAG
jgi:ATP-dependent Clp protease ATP-binding subunit ClpC